MFVKIIYKTENGSTRVARYRNMESEEAAIDEFEYTIGQNWYVEIVNVVSEEEVE